MKRLLAGYLSWLLAFLSAPFFPSPAYAAAVLYSRSMLLLLLCTCSTTRSTVLLVVTSFLHH